MQCGRKQELLQRKIKWEVGARDRDVNSTISSCRLGIDLSTMEPSITRLKRSEGWVHAGSRGRGGLEVGPSLKRRRDIKG